MESDSIGTIDVPSDKYWGAQTERSFENFEIGGDKERMPQPVIRAFAILKKAAARVNKKNGLDAKLVDAISEVCDEVKTSFFNVRSDFSWKIRCTFSFGNLANRIWNSNKHERQ